MKGAICVMFGLLAMFYYMETAASHPTDCSHPVLKPVCEHSDLVEGRCVLPFFDVDKTCALIGLNCGCMPTWRNCSNQEHQLWAARIIDGCVKGSSSSCDSSSGSCDGGSVHVQIQS